MAFTYTDSGKTIKQGWGWFRVVLREAVETGDLLSWYNTDSAYTVQFANESDSQVAQAVAGEPGSAGETIWACLGGEFETLTAIGTGGVATKANFAASTDFLGAPLYLGLEGKPSSTAGSTYSQLVGFLLARDRILLAPNAIQLNTLGVTATATELNLLDLASLTAGEMLVATGAAAAAWQSTGVKLSAPDISGTVTAASALTMPAFTLGGTLTLNGQTFDAGSGSAQINTTGNEVGLILKGAATAHGCMLRFYHDHTTPALNGIIGEIQYHGYDGAGAPAAFRWGIIQVNYANITDGAEAAEINVYLAHAGAADNLAMTLSGAGRLWVDADIDFSTSADSGAVADHVSLGCYEISAGHRALAISSEEVVVAEVDETKFSHKLPVRINGATYNLMLCVT